MDSIAGGGGFFTLTAYLLTGLPVHNAIATNKLGSSIGTCAAAARYIRNGFVPLKLVCVCVPCALLGSVGGAKLALAVSDTAFRWFMLAALPVVGFYVLKKKNFDGGIPLEKLPFRRTAILCGAIAAVVGCYDGFYGPGTGTFLLLLFTGAAHLELNAAAGTGKILNLSTNLAALAVYIFSGNTIFVLGFAAGAFSLVGNWLGSGSFTRKGSAMARPMMLLVLCIFFCKLIYELILK